MIGNIAPIISANTVITSAQRVTGRRQPALTSRRIAEISVPAWLMPIQNTKLVRYKRPERRPALAAEADAVPQLIAPRHGAAGDDGAGREHDGVEPHRGVEQRTDQIVGERLSY